MAQGSKTYQRFHSPVPKSLLETGPRVSQAACCLGFYSVRVGQEGQVNSQEQQLGWTWDWALLWAWQKVCWANLERHFKKIEAVDWTLSALFWFGFHCPLTFEGDSFCIGFRRDVWEHTSQWSCRRDVGNSPEVEGKWRHWWRGRGQ